MTFDDLLRRYFGNTEIDSLAADALAAGMDRMRVDLGLEADRGRRFALWSLLFLLGDAPDLDATFEDADDRNAARDFMDMTQADFDAD